MDQSQQFRPIKPCERLPLPGTATETKSRAMQTTQFLIRGEKQHEPTSERGFKGNNTPFNLGGRQTNQECHPLRHHRCRTSIFRVLPPHHTLEVAVTRFTGRGSEMGTGQGLSGRAETGTGPARNSPALCSSHFPQAATSAPKPSQNLSSQDPGLEVNRTLTWVGKSAQVLTGLVWCLLAMLGFANESLWPIRSPPIFPSPSPCGLLQGLRPGWRLC